MTFGEIDAYARGFIDALERSATIVEREVQWGVDGHQVNIVPLPATIRALKLDVDLTEPTYKYTWVGCGVELVDGRWQWYKREYPAHD
jgi:hypothetical protein